MPKASLSRQPETVPHPLTGAPTPLTWAELTPALEPQRYNLKTIFRRLFRQKTHPMAPLLVY
jgi:DNA primase